MWTRAGGAAAVLLGIVSCGNGGATGSDDGSGSGGGGTGAQSSSDGGRAGAAGASSTGGSGGSSNVPLAAKPSAGCGASASPPVGAQTLTVGALERSYIVSLPANYDPTHEYPLVFAFHGQGASGAAVSGPYYFGIEQKGGRPSIFVYPDGLDAGDGTGWPNQDGRDVAFFDAMLTTMENGYCVDENRVFSTGHSYGGIMTYTLACERATVLRGVAPVSGARWASSTCTGPVAAWGAHGNPDPTVSYDLGVAAMARILATNGCATDDTTPVDPKDVCIAYSCDPGYPVTWCEHDEGHNWPAFAAQSIKDFIDSF